ncbi:MAG: YARHG domain-containing protein [Clostridium sp.]|uniref:YARHG domain-containing protein n=1 Tax=Clostridium sp. TaxID=1506 RepID=UPI003D6CFABD
MRVSQGYYKFKDDGASAPLMVKEEKIKGGEMFDSSTNASDSTKSLTAEATVSNEFIFEDSDKTYLTVEQVSTLSIPQLAIARNEIFARHGFVFKTLIYSDYFYGKSWYSPDFSYDGGESVLNKYEKANYAFIQKYEK